MLDWEAINREHCYYYNKDDLIFSVLKEILVLNFQDNAAWAFFYNVPVCSKLTLRNTITGKELLKNQEIQRPNSLIKTCREHEWTIYR